MHSTRSAVRAQPNVTPMIDVMLVLLIIFMVVGPLLHEAFIATPPEARYSTRHPDDAGEAVIGLDAQGRLFFNKTPTDSVALRTALVERFRERPDDRVVFIRADHSLPYGQLQDAMSLASSAGAHVVGLVSSEPRGKER